jgi:putative ABC transport system permease protein
MTILYRIRALVRWLFRRDEIERALDSDLSDYIERAVAEKMRAGMSEAEARRAARIELGGVEQTKDSVRATLALGPVEKVVADVGYALRTLRRQKTFTTVAVSTLALGIGVNVAIFSLTEQILLRPLPVPEPDQLANLTDPGPKMVGRGATPFEPSAASSASGAGDTVFSYPTFRDLEREQAAFAGLAAHRYFEASLSTGEQTRLGTGILVSGSYFSVLGLNPVLGRLLNREDDRVDGEAEAVVLSHAYWQSEFGADPQIVGRRLLVNRQPLTIVGVAPPGFSGTTVGARASVFVPITMRNALRGTFGPIPVHENRLIYWVHLFARLEPGVTREEAAAAINPVYRAIVSESEAPRLTGTTEQELEAFRTRPIVLEPGARGQTSASRTLDPARNSLELLLAVSCGVLLLCCANVAGLMLVRSTARTGEIAVRASMGATRGRLASLLLAESLVLALPAALLSLPIALVTLRAAARGVPRIPTAAFDVELSAAAALVAIGAAVLSAVVCGLLPLRDVLRTDPGKTLQAYGVRQTPARGVTRFRAGLATVQIALSMALLALTGAFAQSLANIARIDLGLDLDAVAMVSISPPPAQSPEEGASLLARVDEELRAIPGVSSVASSMVPLLSRGGFEGRVAVEGLEADPQLISNDFVSSNYFEMFGIEVLAGRGFSEPDISRQVAVVNQRFAERVGLGRSIVGRRIPDLDVEIVGMVADAQTGIVTGEIGAQVFRPLPHGGTFYVRGSRPPEELLDTVRETVNRTDPSVVITRLVTMEQQFLANIGTERFVAGASTGFAVLATVLAGLGLYGVLAYAVAQRSREIALRFALGAPAPRIRRMVLRQIAAMAAAGIVLGVAAAVLLGRAAQSLLYGVAATDPLALAAAAAVLAAVMLGAAYLPARRASRVDPMSVLRYE